MDFEAHDPLIAGFSGLIELPANMHEVNMVTSPIFSQKPINIFRKIAIKNFIKMNQLSFKKAKFPLKTPEF